jgi:hypothetical protein
MSRAYSDLFSCKQKDKEPLQNYFRRFVHLRAQEPNVLDAVAINAAIMGLRAGQFRSHLMRERPKTIQRLYEEFEKYCRSDIQDVYGRTITPKEIWQS